MESWFLLATKSGEQDKAEDNLLSQMFEVLNPKIKVYKADNSYNLIPLFPGYMFVRFDPVIKSARVVNNTRGVQRLVTFGSDPIAVSPKIIDRIRQQTSSLYNVKTNSQYKKGDKVKILNGPFAGIEAIFQETDGNKRSMLLLTMFGRQKEMEFANTQFA